MRVLVDALNLKEGQGGIHTYTSNVVRELALRRSLEVTVVTSMPEAFDGMELSLVRAPPRTRSFLYRTLWREAKLPGLLKKVCANILFSPVPELPFRRTAVPSVMVVHDVGPLLRPDLYGWARSMRYRMLLPRACGMASGVVCVSEATRADLVSAIRCLRVDVVGEAPRMLPEGETTADRSAARFFLYVGSGLRHKNLRVIVRAVAEPALEGDIQLRIVGPISPQERDELVAEAERVGVERRVEISGWVDERDLAGLYRDAVGVVLPTLHEGFGLPLLEALSAGKIVVASDLPVLRELGADLPRYVADRHSPAVWAGEMQGVADDDAGRAAMAELGPKRAAKFTWGLVADQLEQVLVGASS